ncbi:GNAT family N-acetyltransferase [Opitutia bacterium ISCC 51]|nr:GNAT family N-acetyltransferase [Opitutae bacterium ISCC 51]QXD27294.1 GNAT family N-acetyltransferase [Opitutae bacterium ISCC 52]
MSSLIKEISTGQELADSFHVMRALRPHLIEDAYIEKVRRQQKQGYHLVALIDEENEIAALAGYRFAEFMAWGKVLYLDDLITDPTKLKRGYAGALMDWLEEEGKRNRCNELHLDTGHQRLDAHRLYHKKGWQISCHHMSKVLTWKVGSYRRADR